MLTQYETKRLYLCILPPTLENARRQLSFYKKNAQRFEKYEPSRPDNFYTEEYHYSCLRYEYSSAKNGTGIRFWLFKKENPSQMIGTISFLNIRRGFYQDCVMGYKLDTDYEHQGFACEALTKGIRIIFDELGLHRIEAYIAPDNLASLRVIDSLGFSHEGTTKKSIQIQGLWTDHEQYALLNPGHPL